MAIVRSGRFAVSTKSEVIVICKGSNTSFRERIYSQLGRKSHSNGSLKVAVGLIDSIELLRSDSKCVR